MSYLKFKDLKEKNDSELETIYERNCGAKEGSMAGAEQSSNRSKIELILSDRENRKDRNLAWIAIVTSWFGILVAILIALFKKNCI